MRRSVFPWPEPKDEFSWGDQDVFHRDQRVDQGFQIHSIGRCMAGKKDHSADARENQVMQQGEEQHLDQEAPSPGCFIDVQMPRISPEMLDAINSLLGSIQRDTGLDVFSAGNPD